MDKTRLLNALLFGFFCGGSFYFLGKAFLTLPGLQAERYCIFSLIMLILMAFVWGFNMPSQEKHSKRTEEKP